jgi:hypothetical protein
MVAVLTGTVWIARATRHSRANANKSDSTNSGNLSGLDDIHSNVASLEAALAHTQERLKQIEANQKPLEATAPSAPDPAKRPRPTQAQIEEARQKVDAEYKLRAKTFGAEVRDEVWAQRSEERISAATKAVLPEGAKIESVSCRTSLCKFELSFSKQEDERPFGSAFANGMDAEGMRGYHFDELDQRPDGSYPLQVLVFRNGYPMPGFNDPK